MAKGAGVGRGVMGLQTLDASRGIFSPWGRFVPLEVDRTYLPVKEWRRVMRGCSGCEVMDVTAPHRVDLPRIEPRSFHPNCALPFLAGCCSQT
jgi:hypothetical protein